MDSMISHEKQVFSISISELRKLEKCYLQRFDWSVSGQQNYGSKR